MVATSFKYGKGYYGTSTFTYIRQYYLNKYLENKNKKILWLQRAEKRYFQNGMKNLHIKSGIENTEYRTFHKIIL